MSLRIILLAVLMRGPMISSISIHNIVRFACSECSGQADKCCFGTVIHPRFVITTAFCAKTCHSITKNGRFIKIFSKHIHQHYKNYVIGRKHSRNDLGIVEFATAFRDGDFVKLSAIDFVSAIGLKALIPIMDGLRPRLQVTVIEKCLTEQMRRGYYVCAVNRVNNNMVKSCLIGEGQGVPLMLDDRIFGVAGTTSQDMCRFPQKPFISVGPALTWIRSTIEWAELNPPITNETDTLKSRVIRMRAPVKFVVRNTPKITSAKTTTTTFSTTETTTRRTILARERITTTAPTVTSTLRDTTTKIEITTLTTPTCPVIPTSSSTSETTHKVTTTKRITTKARTTTAPTMTSSTKTTTVTPTTTKTTTKKPTTTKTSTVKTTTTKTTSTTTEATDFPSGEVIATRLSAEDLNTGYEEAETVVTSAMDWFNKNIKDKLREGPMPILVLTTSTPSYDYRETTEFVDLT